MRRQWSQILVIDETHEQLSPFHEPTTTQNVAIEDLSFLHATQHWAALYRCMKLQIITSYSIRIMGGHEISCQKYKGI